MAKEFIKIAQKAINKRIQENKKTNKAQCGVDIVGGSLYFWMQYDAIKTFSVDIDEDLILDPEHVDNYVDCLMNDLKEIVGSEMGIV